MNRFYSFVLGILVFTNSYLFAQSQDSVDSNYSTTQQESTSQTPPQTQQSHKMPFFTTARMELLNGFQLQFSKFDTNSNISEIAILQQIRYYLGAHFSLSAHIGLGASWRVVDSTSFGRGTFGFYMPLGVELSIVDRPFAREGDYAYFGIGATHYIATAYEKSEVYTTFRVGVPWKIGYVLYSDLPTAKPNSAIVFGIFVRFSDDY
ncbi:hypothetical protein CQA49_00430 [Helicobacter sp. MIT 00-7814]|uniref:hypothetical protein n=1 Tax=unclassified Helicobacter TaxID=2593540 RepID=UPI000E1E63BC|nr:MULTISPECIES: hypothetical protein [unclassified Helicobacter]RDU57164.1 hypothetical protein CQA49_00430 [Helicobacter sp. MIT 00-7814]RDU57716.1 hypothetical protein CQA37_00430 [Helicobacter sp. MIT 99-10781]